MANVSAPHNFSLLLIMLAQGIVSVHRLSRSDPPRADALDSTAVCGLIL
jgi:hypothetical protein